MPLPPAISPSHSLKVVGAPGSPYTRKLRAVLRFRRIPHTFVIRGSRDDHDIPAVPVGLIPVLVIPGFSSQESGEESGEEGGDIGAAEASIDTTPLIRKLEKLYPERSVLPSDAALGFINSLLEDYGDEWLTKAMFHYRWSYQLDIDKAGAVLPLWRDVCVKDAQLAPFSKLIKERQIGRLGVVGSNEVTGPIIEASFVRFLQLMDAHLIEQPFLLGFRPSSADFALFGQLTQLALFDPTSAAVTLETSPRVLAWTEVAEDLSGRDVTGQDWTSRDAVPETLSALLAEVGRVYVPVMLANAAAVAGGASSVECEVDGREWVQKPFPYQQKCLAWLRDDYAALAPADRSAVDRILAGTGCEALWG